MSAINIIPWNEFLSFSERQKNEHKFLTKEDLLIIGNEPQLSNWPAVNSVKTVDDLEKFKVQVCSRPLVLLVQCGKHVPIGQRLNNRGQVLNPSDLEWWLVPSTSRWENSTYRPGDTTRASDPSPVRFLEVKFAVVVDTSHPVIDRQFREGFKMAESFIKQKKSFCVEFNFNPVILDWWLNQGPKHWLRPDCMDTSYCIGGRLSITNTTAPCHRLDFGVWWTLCLPCYCALAIPYKIWRNIACQVWDYSLKIEGSVQVVSNFNHLKIHQ